MLQTLRWYPLLLLSTVFITGAAVLIFEVTAVRALSPFFGASIVVVSSVLSVILGALSVGYYIGGRLADRYPDPRLLYLLLCFSGLVMNVLYLLSLYIFPIASLILPLLTGPLILAILFFFFPAFLLGIDSPFVIKLLTKDADAAHNGALVGSTFFWSTIGSIIGSLLAGFVLIPFAGVKLTIIGTATLLSVGACIAFLLLHPHTKQHQPYVPLAWIFMLTLVSVTIATVALRVVGLDTKPGTLLFADDGYYSRIEVREQTHGLVTIRSLHREVNHSSAMYLGTTTDVFRYTQFSNLWRALETPTPHFLMLGGGAYTVPRKLLTEHPTMVIDVAEIEPSLYEIAQTYFELPTSSPRLRNHVSDARRFLMSTTTTYDIIFSDTYNSGHHIPFHLSTREFFQLVSSRLAPDGIYFINLIGLTDQDAPSLTGAFVRTLQSVFPSVELYSASDNAKAMRNLIIVARNTTDPLVTPDEIRYQTDAGERTLAELRIPFTALNLSQQPILTDDKAPEQHLMARQIIASDYLE
jgi:spermidine synthase